MVCSLDSRWRVWLTLSLVALLLTACQPGRLALQNLAVALTTPTTVVEEADAAATATPTAIETATPGPTPTATPQPLASADPDQAASLTAEGQRLFLQSDLTAAESAFIDAMAADHSYVPAYLGLTRVYLYWPQYGQQALTTAQTRVPTARRRTTDRLWASAETDTEAETGRGIGHLWRGSGMV